MSSSEELENPTQISRGSVVFRETAPLVSSSKRKNFRESVVDSFKYEKIKTRSTYYLPFLSWVPQYKWKEYLMPDIIAGLTVAFVIIPQGISYGSLALVDPIHGLYCAFLPPFIYSFFGSSKHLSIGPEAVASLLVGQTVAKFVENVDDPETLPIRAGIAASLGLFVGIITLLGGIFRLGFLDSILSKATITGFITAVSFVIMTEQLRNLFGIDSHWEENSSPISKLIFIFEHLEESKWITCLMGLSGLFFLFLMNYLKGRFPSNVILKFFPSVFALVVVSCLISWGFDLKSKGLDIYGDVKGGFQRPAQYQFPDFATLLTSSFTIMIVGFIETVICAKKFGEKNDYSVSDNRELVALGVANSIASIFGSYPAFGSFPRTKMNDSVGGKTQLSGLVTSLTSLLAILFLLPAFYYLPKTTSAAIVFFAAFSLLEIENIVFLIKVRAIRDFVIMLVTLVVTLAVSIDIGIFVSIAISLVLVVKEVTGYSFDVLGIAPDNRFHPIYDENSHGVQLIEDIMIVRFKEALFFARTGFLVDRLRRVEKFGTLFAHPSDDVQKTRSITAVIFDLSRMAKIDASALKRFKEICSGYKEKNIQVLMVKLRSECHEDFLKAGIIDIVGESNFYKKLKDAVISVKGDTLYQRPHSTFYD